MKTREAVFAKMSGKEADQMKNNQEIRNSCYFSYGAMEFWTGRSLDMSALQTLLYKQAVTLFQPRTMFRWQSPFLKHLISWAFICWAATLWPQLCSPAATEVKHKETCLCWRSPSKESKTLGKKQGADKELTCIVWLSSPWDKLALCQVTQMLCKDVLEPLVGEIDLST